MNKDEFSLGMEVQLGIYKGNVVDIGDDYITVQFKTWASISSWTNDYPKITFKYFAMLEKVPDEG